ncbi:MAG TPA: arginase [Aggregatilineales bacterium]|nr:arginase [Anaerolineales bacterium]HRE49709.1 arginase [Aggregatilineales bacterium]
MANTMQKQKKTIRIIGAPMDYGQARRGVDMGPSAVRYAGLQDRLRRLGYEVIDYGNIPMPIVEEVVEHEHGHDNARARHLPTVVNVCQAIYTTAETHIGADDFAIFLGGDHSISVGSVAAMRRRGNVGVIWVDAHGDYNTPETTISGNIHGMPVSALVGEGAQPLIDVGYPGAKLTPQQLVMIGIRDLDSAERTRLTTSGIHIFTMADIDTHGMAGITRQALDILGGHEAIHVSLDLDSLDPDHAPGVGTPVPGGLTYREAHLLMEMLSQAGVVTSMDIVEINPILDQRNQTAELAVELVASLLGKRIL